MSDVGQLIGKTFARVERGDDCVVFEFSGGKGFEMGHIQDCCESVELADVAGDLKDLEGVPILSAEESSNSDEPPLRDYAESYTWTFYRITTIKGTVVLRWYGESNGYYSEEVSVYPYEKRSPESLET